MSDGNNHEDQNEIASYLRVNEPFLACSVENRGSTLQAIDDLLYLGEQISDADTKFIIVVSADRYDEVIRAVRDRSPDLSPSTKFGTLVSGEVGTWKGHVLWTDFYAALRDQFVPKGTVAIYKDWQSQEPVIDPANPQSLVDYLKSAEPVSSFTLNIHSDFDKCIHHALKRAILSTPVNTDLLLVLPPKVMSVWALSVRGFEPVTKLEIIKTGCVGRLGDYDVWSDGTWPEADRFLPELTIQVFLRPAWM